MDTLRRFKNEEIDILIATDLAARGLDIENVKTVINFILPNTLKHYIHRVGRTARAGKTGRSISLVGENERQLLKDILKTCKVPAKMRIVPQGKIFFKNKKTYFFSFPIKKLFKSSEINLKNLNQILKKFLEWNMVKQ